MVESLESLCVTRKFIQRLGCGSIGKVPIAGIKFPNQHSLSRFGEGVGELQIREIARTDWRTAVDDYIGDLRHSCRFGDFPFAYGREWGSCDHRNTESHRRSMVAVALMGNSEGYGVTELPKFGEERGS